MEISLASGHEVHEALPRLDGELSRLANEGPDGNAVALAKFLVHARLERELKAAKPSTPAAAVHSAGMARLRHALRPWAGERALKALDEVTVSSVRAAVKRVMSGEHRVVVTTLPKAK
jgi:hypothetical protein